MKCISLIQPWATLIIHGAKRFETRGWRTLYRGPLTIHASGCFPSGKSGKIGKSVSVHFIENYTGV